MKKIISNTAMKNEHCHFILLFVLFLLSFVSITRVNAQWEQCNNGLGGGEVFCFIIDGNNTYTGIDGGVFITTDNGDNWIAKNKGFISIFIKPAIFSMAISGNNIFAGTGRDGIFLSTNKGENWERKSNGLPYTVFNETDTSYLDIIYAIIINDNNIYAGCRGGVYISTNNGENWTKKNNGLPQPDTSFKGVCSMAVNGNNIYAGTECGVFITKDNGENWFPKNKGMEKMDIFSLAISGNNIYAGTRYGIFLSINNGEDWKNIGLKDTLIDAIIIKENNIFAAGPGVDVSMDNGNSWNAHNTGIEGYAIESIIINGDYIFAGTNNRGIFRAKLSDLGITDVKENEQIVNNLIYPNPASNLVKLKMKEQPGGNVHIQIVDLFGRTVYKSIEPCAEQFNEKTIDCSSFPNGFYSVIVSYENKNEYLRMIIYK